MTICTIGSLKFARDESIHKLCLILNKLTKFIKRKDLYLSVGETKLYWNIHEINSDCDRKYYIGINSLQIKLQNALANLLFCDTKNSSKQTKSLNVSSFKCLFALDNIVELFEKSKSITPCEHYVYC